MSAHEEVPHPEPTTCHRPATVAEIATEKALVSAMISQTLCSQTPSPMSASRQAKHALMDRGYRDEFALTCVRAMLVSMYERGALILTDGVLACTWFGAALLPEHRQEIAAATASGYLPADAASAIERGG
jgi:hypothetical protein